MNSRELVVFVADELLKHIQPRLRASGAGEVVGRADSGDYTFALDEAAEQALPRIIEDVAQRSGIRLASYSEDRGFAAVSGGVSDATHVLVVDPIDGTRPALCGFESCCVSVALAPLRDAGDGRFSASLGEVESAALVEIRSGAAISSARGEGVFQSAFGDRGNLRRIDGLSCKTDLKRLFWAMEMVGRPSDATHALLGNLLDTVSHSGGCFVFNSSSYAISRLITGQLDAYVDPFAAVLHGPAADRWREASRALFGGRVFGLFAYDIAAAAFLTKEAGAVITDARGNSLDEINLLDSSDAAVLSCVAASNATLHSMLLEQIAKGIKSAEM